MKHPFLLLVICLSFPGFSFAQDQPLKSEPFVIGESLELHSKVLREKRILNIYLPQSYTEDSLREFPVIFLLDGSRDEDFIHIAGLVQFGNFSWINMLPESIVVGIANVDRKRDFTYPTTNVEDQKDFPTSGGSGQFIRFLEEELQPLIDAHYRANGTKTIIGQSLGGLLASEILFKKPELFDHYIIISPSLWWDDGSLLKMEPQAFKSGKSIYIGVGQEGEIMEDAAHMLHEKLKALQRPGLELFFGFFEALSHGDTLHLAVYDAFKKIFAEP